jgi:hypothetical protein
MPMLDEKIARLEERLRRLKSRHVRVEARRRTLESRRSRREDTRRKILVGAIVLAKIDQGGLPGSVLQEWLDHALTRQEDRVLFALPARQTSAARSDDSH